MKDDAVKKLRDELNDKSAKWSARAQAVKTAVCDALIMFCGQEEEFAQAVLQSEKSLAAVCEECVKGAGSSISDFLIFFNFYKFFTIRKG